MRFHTKIPLLILFLISGCVTSGEQHSSSVENLNNQQLCTAYIENYSTLYSTDVTSLNEDKKQYLINLLDLINVRGLDRNNCQTVVLGKS
tara:strand:- start:3259 stop:3528 length:270 start_codon:yes stop_codon:yes gene_type:complete